ncbi:hypothetical protein CPB85DRAFT_1491314 [Mucidula mucida]|nr:hypothetical protein CPB85DRAFT_1491314 [Mucidula mucida]
MTLTPNLLEPHVCFDGTEGVAIFQQVPVTDNAKNPLTFTPLPDLGQGLYTSRPLNPTNRIMEGMSFEAKWAQDPARAVICRANSGATNTQFLFKVVPHMENENRVSLQALAAQELWRETIFYAKHLRISKEWLYTSSSASLRAFDRVAVHFLTPLQLLSQHGIPSPSIHRGRLFGTPLQRPLATGDLEEGQGDSRKIRYINLQAHPALRAIDELESEALRLGDRAAFIIREEYRLFMQHAISCTRDGHGHWTHFFVTGQSGIVFYIASRQSTYYFSSSSRHNGNSAPDSGVTQNYSKKLGQLDPTNDSQKARCIVWASEPQEPRMSLFIKHFGAKLWFMSAWTNKEIAALTQLRGLPHDLVKARLNTGGPVARILFGDQVSPSRKSLEEYIHSAFRGNIFDFSLGDGQQHRVFLVQPAVVIDQTSGRASIVRLHRTPDGRACEGLV